MTLTISIYPPSPASRSLTVDSLFVILASIHFHFASNAIYDMTSPLTLMLLEQMAFLDNGGSPNSHDWLLQDRHRDHNNIAPRAFHDLPKYFVNTPYIDALQVHKHYL